MEKAAVDLSANLKEIFCEHAEEYLALNPFAATFRGDTRYDNQRFPQDPLSDDYATPTDDLNKRNPGHSKNR